MPLPGKDVVALQAVLRALDALMRVNPMDLMQRPEDRVEVKLIIAKSAIMEDGEVDYDVSRKIIRQMRRHGIECGIVYDSEKKPVLRVTGEAVS